MNASTTGFPADRISFWVANWQLESGEVPEIIRGATYELPLCFRWIAEPSPSSGPHHLRTPQDSGDFEVRGQHHMTKSAEYLVVDGVPQPLLGDSWDPDPRWTLPPIAQVTGTIVFEIPAGWAGGWDDWTRGAPLPWPLFKVEVERLRMGYATATRRHKMDEPVAKSGLSPRNDFLVDARILNIQVEPAVPVFN